MSRGPGTAQRRIFQLFSDHPDRRFTAWELAELVYPDATAITHSQYTVVSRAAKCVAEQLGWINWLYNRNSYYRKATSQTSAKVQVLASVRAQHEKPTAGPGAS